jgi:hypothetical protein
MFKLPQPSMALNAPDAVSRYAMHVTYHVPPTEPLDVTLRQVRQAALRQPDKTLKCLVINAHGIYEGTKPTWTGGHGIALGTGIRWHNTHYFSLLREGNANSRPLVSRIFTTACGAAAGTSGEILCKSIAKYSGAHVTAGNIVQVSEPGQATPYYISEFEGLAQEFAPDGAVVWQHEYPRVFYQNWYYGPN